MKGRLAKQRNTGGGLSRLQSSASLLSKRTTDLGGPDLSDEDGPDHDDVEEEAREASEAPEEEAQRPKQCQPLARVYVIQAVGMLEDLAQMTRMMPNRRRSEIIVTPPFANNSC